MADRNEIVGHEPKEQIEDKRTINNKRGENTKVLLYTNICDIIQVYIVSILSSVNKIINIQHWISADLNFLNKRLQIHVLPCGIQQ